MTQKSGTSQKELARKLNKNCYAWFGGPIEKLEHDLSLEHLTPERFHSTTQYLRACEKVAIWRLQQGELTDDAGYDVGEVTLELARIIHNLIAKGDVMLARKLPSIIETLQTASTFYGRKFSGRMDKRLSIEKILDKHKPHELLQMLGALHPNWHLILLHIYHPKLQMLEDPQQEEILKRKRSQIEAFSKDRLRKFFQSKEHWVGEHQGERTEEWRPHGIATMIERIIALREAENENINLFVEFLWRGFLWSGPERTFVKCEWHGRLDMPERKDTRAWMKVVMPYLRRVTKDNPMKLHVLERLIAARKAVFVGDNAPNTRLADDKTDHIWNQVRTRIAQAWTTMAGRAHKRNSKKHA